MKRNESGNNHNPLADSLEKLKETNRKLKKKATCEDELRATKIRDSQLPSEVTRGGRSLPTKLTSGGAKPKWFSGLVGEAKAYMIDFSAIRVAPHHHRVNQRSGEGATTRGEKEETTKVCPTAAEANESGTANKSVCSALVKNLHNVGLGKGSPKEGQVREKERAAIMGDPFSLSRSSSSSGPSFGASEDGLRIDLDLLREAGNFKGNYTRSQWAMPDLKRRLGSGFVYRAILMGCALVLISYFCLSHFVITLALVGGYLWFSVKTNTPLETALWNIFLTFCNVLSFTANVIGACLSSVYGFFQRENVRVAQARDLQSARGVARQVV